MRLLDKGNVYIHLVYSRERAWYFDENNTVIRQEYTSVSLHPMSFTVVAMPRIDPGGEI